jgi:hypothetical protein
VSVCMVAGQRHAPRWRLCVGEFDGFVAGQMLPWPHTLLLHLAVDAARQYLLFDCGVGMKDNCILLAALPTTFLLHLAVDAATWQWMLPSSTGSLWRSPERNCILLDPLVTTFLLHLTVDAAR